MAKVYRRKSQIKINRENYWRNWIRFLDFFEWKEQKLQKVNQTLKISWFQKKTINSVIPKVIQSIVENLTCFQSIKSQLFEKHIDQEYTINKFIDRATKKSYRSRVKSESIECRRCQTRINRVLKTQKVSLSSPENSKNKTQSIVEKVKN